MVPPSQSVLRTSTRRKVRGVGVRSMSSKSCITEAAVIVGGMERGAGREAHHSFGLLSGSVMIVFCVVFLDGMALKGGELFIRKLDEAVNHELRQQSMPWDDS